jgi:chromate transporter
MSQMVDELNSRETVTLGALFLAFAKIGLCGVSSLLAWTRRVIVDEKHWMNQAEFAETLGICQFLPGPEIANISIYVGSKFRGPVGAIVALLGLTLAPLWPPARNTISPVSASTYHPEDPRWAIRCRGRAAHCDRD